MSVIGECRRWQLLLVANQDYFPRLMLERDQVVQLHTLACLVDYQVINVALHQTFQFVVC
jgi:hypothetical protein